MSNERKESSKPTAAACQSCCGHRVENPPEDNPAPCNDMATDEIRLNKVRQNEIKKDKETEKGI